MDGDVELIAVRHAAVAETWRGVCYGRLDPELSSSPTRAAAEALICLERDLGSARFDLVWTSPATRCRRLVERLGASLTDDPAEPLPVRIDERLHELGFGRWEGRRWAEIHATEPAALHRWSQDPVSRSPPGGESAAQLASRLGAWLEHLPPGRHLWVAHAGPVRAAWVHLGELDWPTALRHPVPHLRPVGITPSAGE